MVAGTGEVLELGAEREAAVQAGDPGQPGAVELGCGQGSGRLLRPVE
jgi:hypothetical protein